MMENGSDAGQASLGTDSVEASGDTVEIRIKTLDSATYTIRVSKNISIPALKERLASVVNVPAENQRLICRGRVLKDDHLLSSYNVEDGHTLHLVERQPTPPANTDGDSSQGQTNASDVASNRTSIARSVVLGTINLPDMGEGGFPDLNSIITAVLSSVGTMPGDNAGNAMSAASALRQGLTPNSLIFGENNFMRAFEVAPDAITTMLLYINLLGLGEANVNSGPSEPVTTSTRATVGAMPMPAATPTAEATPTVGATPPAAAPVPNALPYNPRSLLTPSALGNVVHRVQELLTGQITRTLGNFSSALDGEPTLVDTARRQEVQNFAHRTGNMMHQLGALFMELGRTMLTLHMGQTPADSVVNPGPAVFIGPNGPNPVMVQPFPSQTMSPFGALPMRMPSSQTSNVSGGVAAPRNLNIHIHASDLLSANQLGGTGNSTGISQVPSENLGTNASQQQANGSSPSNTNGVSREHAMSSQISGQLAQENGIPVMGRVTTALSVSPMNGSSANPRFPQQSAPLQIFQQIWSSSAGNLHQSLRMMPRSQTSNAGAATAVQNQVQDSLQVPSTGGAGGECVSASQNSGVSTSASCPNENTTHVSHTEPGLDKCEGLVGKDSNSELNRTQCKNEHEQSSSSSSANKTEGGTDTGIASHDSGIGLEEEKTKSHEGMGNKASAGVPVGLGLGPLQPLSKRRRSQVPRQQEKSVGAETSNAATAEGHAPPVQLPQQLLSLLGGMSNQGERLSVSSRREAGESALGNSNMVESMMGLMRSPAMGNILSQVMNTIGDGQQGLGTASGSNSGEGQNLQGFDVANVLQQTLPLMSQLLGGGLVNRAETAALSLGDVPLAGTNTEVDMADIVQKIEHGDAPREILTGVVQKAAQLSGTSMSNDVLITDELANEYMQLLHHDIANHSNSEGEDGDLSEFSEALQHASKKVA